MFGRRGSSLGVQIVFIVAIMVAFFYAFFLYQKMQTQLDRFERNNNNLVIEKEDLNRDVQLLRETQAQLKESLQQKEDDCSKNQLQQRDIIEELRRQERQDKRALTEEMMRHTSQYEALQQSFDNVKQDYTDSKEELQKKVDEMDGWKEEASKNERMKGQECQNEITLIKDEVANCKRKLQTIPTLAKGKKENVGGKKEEKNEEVEDQKFQIAQPGEAKPEYIGKVVNASTSSHSAVQGGLLSGQKDNQGGQVNQVLPPMIKNKSSKNPDSEKGVPQGGEGGFHGDGKNGGQVEAPKGGGDAREEAESTHKETDDNEQLFKPIPPAVMSDNDKIKPRNDNKELPKGDNNNNDEDTNYILSDNKSIKNEDKDFNNVEINGENNNNYGDNNNNIEIEKRRMDGDDEGIAGGEGIPVDNNNKHNNNHNNNNNVNDPGLIGHNGGNVGGGGGFNNNIGHNGGGDVDGGFKAGGNRPGDNEIKREI